MKTLSALLTAAIFTIVAVPATAATAPPVNKTWVSSTGTDTGSCQLVAPCRTFAYAITETNFGGEIDVKDSGAYGAFIIDKSISIIADGVLATVGAAASGVAGIDVDVGSSGLVVIRGLLVDTHFGSKFGILVRSPGGSISLDHRIIQII